MGEWNDAKMDGFINKIMTSWRPNKWNIVSAVHANYIKLELFQYIILVSINMNTSIYNIDNRIVSRVLVLNFRNKEQISSHMEIKN